MTNDETNETLLLALRSLRSMWMALGDYGPQVQAIYDYLKARDPKFENEFQTFEQASKAELSLPIALSLQMLDDIIRKLEADRKPPRTN